jgi:hypothetical protein
VTVVCWAWAAIAQTTIPPISTTQNSQRQGDRAMGVPGLFQGSRLERGDGDVPPPKCCPAIAVAVLPERHAPPLRAPEGSPDHGSTERGAGRETTRLKVGSREWPQRAENWPPEDKRVGGG